MSTKKSAKKKVQVGQRNFKLNKSYKSTVKNLLKNYRLSLKLFEIKKDSKSYEKLKSLVSKLYSKIDKAAKKKVFHRRKAARKKSRLSKLLKSYIEKINFPV